MNRGNKRLILRALGYIGIGIGFGALLLLVILHALGTFDEAPPLQLTTAKKKNEPVKARLYVNPDGEVHWIHICCDCALTHHVTVNLRDTFGLDGSRRRVVDMEWLTDVDKTEDNRRKLWGPFWKRGNNSRWDTPFSAEFGFDRR